MNCKKSVSFSLSLSVCLCAEGRMFIFFLVPYILTFFPLQLTCAPIPIHYRRLLHQPLIPLDGSALAPSASSTTPPASYPFTPKAPFFPASSSSPSPPSPSPPASSLATFPANVSSLVLPHSPSKRLFPPKILIPILLSSAFLALTAASVVFFYRRRRRRGHYEVKSTRSDSYRLFPANGAVSDGRKAGVSRPSSEFLYLGTLANSRTVGRDAGSGNVNAAAAVRSSPCGRVASPELRPLPPLARPNHGNGAGVESEEEEEEELFFSPKGSSLSKMSPAGTRSSTTRAFENVARKEDDLKSSNSSSRLSSSSNLSTPVTLSSRGPSRSPSKSPNSSASLHDLRIHSSVSPISGSSKSPSPPSSRDWMSPSADSSLNNNSSNPSRSDPSPAKFSLKRLDSNQFSAGNVGFMCPTPPPPPPPPRPRTPSPPKRKPPTQSIVSPPIEKDLDSRIPQPPLEFAKISKPNVPLPPPLPPRLGPSWEAPIRTPATSRWPGSRPPVVVTPCRPLDSKKPAENFAGEVQEQADSVETNGEAPKPKLKPLHWDKVRASSDRAMVWDQIKLSSFQLNEEMIETLFVCKTSNPTQKETTKRPVLPSPFPENRVLDPKKSQNIAILLRALNVTKEEVCEALLEGNTDSFGVELLETLLKMAPTKEEEIKLKEFKDDSPIKLGPAERFLKAVLDIPFAFKRVDAMLYMVNFDSEVNYLVKSFETLEAACEELRNSRMFLKLLEAVLKTGNRMNVGTNRGDAQAFKLDTLLKLADVKGTDGKTTLLHFVVQEITRTEGSRASSINQNPPTGHANQTNFRDDIEFRKRGLQVVSGLSGELINVKKAAAMDSDVLSSYVSKLAGGVGKIAEVVMLNDALSPQDRSSKFSNAMNGFLKRAEEGIIKVQAHESVALSLVKEITEYFHGNSAREEAHPFRIFMVVRDFLSVLDQVCKEVGKINERTIVSSARQFPVPVNPTLPSVFPKFCPKRQDSSDEEGSSTSSY